MPVAQWLLDMLVCPACRTAVAATADHSGLHCEACRRIYPIVEDIPIMLVAEALPDDAEPGAG